MNLGRKRVRRRRHVRLETLQDVLAEARKICQAEHIECLGNWSPGQIFEHLAKAFRSSLVESDATLPLRHRLFARLLKPWLLRFGLLAGFQIDRFSDVAAREFLPRASVSDSEGLKQLEAAVEELTSETMTARHNLFGRMSPRDWESMHCRHAELHLSFLRIVRS